MKKILLSTLLTLTIFSIGQFVMAEEIEDNAGDPQSGMDGNSPSSGMEGSRSGQPSKQLPTLGNPLEADSISELLLTMADVIIFIGVILAVFAFIFIGFKFVWAQGDPAALKTARSWFYAAVIGTAILISSKVIVEVIKNTFTSAGIVNEDLFNEP